MRHFQLSLKASLGNGTGNMEPKLHWVRDKAINGSIWWAASPERVEAFALNVNSALQILLISSRNHNMWRKKHHTTLLKAGFRNDMEGSSCTPKTIHEQYAHPYSRVLLVTQYPGFSIGPQREEMIKAILGIQSVISKFQKPSLRKMKLLAKPLLWNGSHLREGEISFSDQRFCLLGRFEEDAVKISEMVCLFLPRSTSAFRLK